MRKIHRQGVQAHRDTSLSALYALSVVKSNSLLRSWGGRKDKVNFIKEKSNVFKTNYLNPAFNQVLFYKSTPKPRLCGYRVTDENCNCKTVYRLKPQQVLSLRFFCKTVNLTVQDTYGNEQARNGILFNYEKIVPPPQKKTFSSDPYSAMENVSTIVRNLKKCSCQLKFLVTST